MRQSLLSASAMRKRPAESAGGSPVARPSATTRATPTMRSSVGREKNGECARGRIPERDQKPRETESEESTDTRNDDGLRENESQNQSVGEPHSFEHRELSGALAH